MAKPKIFPIRESEKQIRSMMRSSDNQMSVKRLHALLIFKQHESTGISKRDVAERTGTAPNSVGTWREAYISGGLDGMLAHGKKGNRPSVIGREQQEALREKLNDPGNGLAGFVELKAWFDSTFGTDISYKTLNGFVRRKFGASSKVARKSHVRKDPEKVAAFKKTSRSSA